MFYGQYNAALDSKWRLLLPGEYAAEFGDNPDSTRILFVEGNGCLQIFLFPNGEDRGLPFQIARTQIKKCRSRGRITIPEMFRNSTSFYCGPTVTIAGKGDHLELWPRPAENKKKKIKE